MTTAHRLRLLGAAADRELRRDILPYWATRAVDSEQGGFFGAIAVDGRPDPNAGKGGVLNARILWTFSAAFRHRPEPLYRQIADRAFNYLVEHFWDPEHSGLYWEVDHRGQMLLGRKQTYGQAFGIYALAEYFRATGVQEALDRANRLFDDIETRALDPVRGGYWEARGRDWQPIEDIRLSEIDLNAPFSMNNHLHLLEAYTTLTLASGEARPRARLRALLELMLDRFVDAASGHLILFFDEHWRSMSKVISYGHDIEASWPTPSSPPGSTPSEAVSTSSGARTATSTRTRTGGHRRRRWWASSTHIGSRGERSTSRPRRRRGTSSTPS
jgi:mannobiose 2-epimerase